MDIPGWVFVLVGSVVAVISFIIYANTGTFQLFILIGAAFFLYGIGKTAVAKLRAKNEEKINREMAKYSKPTTFKDLPIGQEYYRQQYKGGPGGHAQQPWQINPHARHPAQTGSHQYAPMQLNQVHTTQRVFQQAQHTNQHHAAQHRPAHQVYHSPYAYCRRCGARNGHVNFCANCGTRMR